MDENTSNTSDDESGLVMPTEDNDIRSFAYSKDQEVARDDLMKGDEANMIEKEQYLMNHSQTKTHPGETSDDQCRSQDQEPCDAIKQEATRIINYRFNKHFKRSIKNSTLTNSRIDDKISLNFVKSPTDEPGDLLNTNEPCDEECNEQPLDFSLKSRKRINSVNDSVEGLNESFKFGLFENNEDTWIANYSSQVHSNETSPEHLESKDTKDDERNIGEFWSQSGNKDQDQDHISNSNQFSNAINFQAWSRSFSGYSQPQHHALTARMLTHREYQERPFLGQLNNIYNGYFRI